MASRPTFPVYLLPSFKVPFRRRPTAASDASRSSIEEPSVPSLSTSLGSSIASSSPGSSPPVSALFDETAVAHLRLADAAAAAAAATTTGKQPPGLIGQDALSSSSSRRLSRASPDTLRCGACSVDVAFGSQIISKGFTGRHGRAFLVAPPASPAAAAADPDQQRRPPPPPPDSKRNLVNVKVGRSETRQLVTGAHVVADISCVVCGYKLGWKYIDAKEASQKYKVGKFILETQRVVAFRSWEDVAVPEMEHAEAVRVAAAGTGTGIWSGSGSRSGSVRKAKSTGGDSDSDADEEIVFDSEDEDECDDIFAGTWNADVVAKRRSSRVSSKRKQSSE